MFLAASRIAYLAGTTHAKQTNLDVKAGIFSILQAKKKAKAKKSTPISTDIGLVTPVNAAKACTASTGPAKGVVRSLTVAAKGVMRTLGGASTATTTNATFSTADRCDGTLTSVGKGKVSLKVRGLKKAVTVKAGQAYLAKARLFQAKKGTTRTAR